MVCLCKDYHIDYSQSQLIFYSFFIASMAEILVARSAGKKPEISPTKIPKPAAKKGSQNGIMDMAELLVVPP